jgi:hypothetical protein
MAATFTSIFKPLGPVYVAFGLQGITILNNGGPRSQNAISFRTGR